MTGKGKLSIALVAAAALVVCGVVYAQYMAPDPGVSAPSDTVDLLFKAASTGDMNTLDSLLSQNENLVQARSKDGKTALHIAAMVGKTKACEALLNHGADVNAKDMYKKTPYYYARIAHWYETSKMLRKRGGRYR